MARLVFIVARDQATRYEELRRTFVNSEHVGVILDRRGGDCRSHDADSPIEARLVERRLSPARSDLQALGWALVRQAL